MSNYYGTIGRGWGLLSDEKVVVWSRGDTHSDFVALDSIEEIASNKTVFFWDDGEWKKVDILHITGPTPTKDLYYGMLSKSPARGLLADRRTIVWADRRLYLERGVWRLVDFFVQRAMPEPASGFDEV